MQRERYKFLSKGEKNEIVVCMCCRNIYRFEWSNSCLTASILSQRNKWLDKLDAVGTWRFERHCGEWDMNLRKINGFPDILENLSEVVDFDFNFIPCLVSHEFPYIMQPGVVYYLTQELDSIGYWIFLLFEDHFK